MTCARCKERVASFMVLWGPLVVMCCYFCAAVNAKPLPVRKCSV